MVQIIVIIASVVLGMFLYPIIQKRYTRFIIGQYKMLNGEKQETENPHPVKKDKKVEKPEKKPSLVGESKFTLSQSKPNSATVLETEKSEEKAPIFAPESGEETGKMDIDVPLEKEEPDEKINEEEEEITLVTGGETSLAGGASYDELMKLKDVIEKPALSEKEEREAARIAFENQETEIIEKLISGSQTISLRVSALIQLRLSELEKEQQENSEEKTSEEEDRELEEFDANQIL